MTKEQAEFFAKSLDESEAYLVLIQHRLFRIREALQKIVGHPVGYQYTEPNERSK